MISTLDRREWDAVDLTIAREKFDEAGTDVMAMIGHARDMLRPVDQHWLVQRLEALWNSTVPAGSLSAAAWLSETGRLIKHLPFDIAAHAIDQSVRDSGNGFTPTAGEILKHAKPLLDDRRRILSRLKDVAARGAGPSKEEPEVQPEDRCSPEEAARIMEQFGYRSKFKPQPLREPTAEELEQLKREMGE